MPDSNVFGRLIRVFGSAASAAAAVESHKRPAPRDLRALGIDPNEFRKIKRFY